jgi:acyl-CoA-binding protein
MTTLREQFEQAADEIKQLTERPDNDTLLELYALFKQGAEGDVVDKPPGFFDFIGTAKHAAWSRMRGMDRDTAMATYVALVRRLLEG